MEDEQTSDEVTFLPETLEPIVFEIIESVLKDKVYDDAKVQLWIDEICSRIQKELIDTNKPFKYVVNCTIMQKNGAGLHLGYSCFWDTANDNTIIARWPNEKRKDPNARLQTIVTVFGLGY